MPDPRMDLDDWVSVQSSQWQIPGEIGRAITMKSRNYVAFRIDDEAGDPPLGVVVFETEKTIAEAEATAHVKSGRCCIGVEELREFVAREQEGTRLRGLLAALKGGAAQHD